MGNFNLPPFEKSVQRRKEYTTRYWCIDEHLIRFEGCYIQSYCCVMPLGCDGTVLAEFYFRSIYSALEFASNFQGFHTAEFWRKKLCDENSESCILKFLYNRKLRMPSWGLR